MVEGWMLDTLQKQGDLLLSWPAWETKSSVVGLVER